MNQPHITPELVASHGLKPDEYERILKLIGRVPSFTELGIFSAMWNEHCSYKSSRIHLKGLPTKAPWVIQGPGENAGVIDIGDGQAVVFKMESHNHPSYIEPYQCATTGIAGASMASAEFGDDSAEKRPAVQVGDPFAEKLLLEACLEIMEADCVIAIQDMGAAGLTCSAVEMGAKGDLGVDLNLDAVPTRETGMSAYEMMLSESQERMLMVLKPEKEKEAEAIFKKCGLDFAVVGYTTPSKRFVVQHGEADPYQGGMQAVAEAWRNITAVGGRPLAITDNLNFGNPERPEIMGQFVGCLKGISEACRTLDFPVVSGNVSLYNETNGRGILPTPSIGGVGLLDDFTKSATLAFKAAGEAILLIGDTQGWLGQSVYLRDVCGREEGAPPPVDLSAEKRNGDVVRGMIRAGTATAVHDVSDGGLLIALAEMAIASGIGVQLLAAPGAIVPHAYWFGEDQARYIVTVPTAEAGLVLAKMKGAGVPCARIGTTGGDTIAVVGETPVSVVSLTTAFESWLPAYMNAKAS